MTLFVFKNYPLTSIEKEAAESRTSKSKKESKPLLPPPAMAILNQYQAVLSMALNGVMKSATFQILTKLAVSIYIVNYFYIRYDFFSSRILIPLAPNTVFVFVKRFLYTMGCTIAASYVFHLLFVAPFDNFRRSLQLNIDSKQH